jgi:predicted acyltransferase
MNPTPKPANQPARLLSLDAFRGATIAGMLLVNNPGSWSDIYPPLAHAPWHGWTPADTIFPFFLWIVGVAMALSFARRVEQGADRGALFRHVVIRSGIIFGLGLLLAAFPFGLLPAHHFSLEKLRIPGVLQRIGLCYLAAGAIFLRTTWKGQLGWAAGLLLGYWALLALVPVPGYGAGVLEPAGNLTGWIDSHLLAGHTWSGAPAPGFDPEGILSTLPAIATTLLGAVAAHLVRTGSGPALSLRLVRDGAILLAVGAVWSLVFPINKSLWTSSYAVFMSGWAMVLLGAFHWLIDVRGWQRWATPLVIYGSNALAMFVLAGLVGRLFVFIKWTDADGKAVALKTWIYQTMFVPLASPVNASLLFALAFVLVFLVIAWALWRKKWFLKI